MSLYWPPDGAAHVLLRVVGLRGPQALHRWRQVLQHEAPCFKERLVPPRVLSEHADERTNSEQTAKERPR